MKKVITLGLGYIGLPTSVLIASKNIFVHGVDINKNIVDTINSGESHIIEPDLNVSLKEVVNKGFLKASNEVQQGDVYIIVVPTPFKKNHEPDTSYVENATMNIIPFLKENDLIIIESTCPVGTTDRIKDLIYSNRKNLKGKLGIAYCPERVLPGNIMHELIHNDRVIGGIDAYSNEQAVLFYSHFVKGKLHCTNAKTAEMCKLVENSSRDIQIAFANELSLICDKAEIDVWELISLANKHPRVNILNPGPGVGGHCIAVDPYFIQKSYPNESKIIALAREVNNNKPLWCINKIKDSINNYYSNYNTYPKIGLFGLTFKPNIDDVRESPSLFICNSVNKFYKKNKIFNVEPNLDYIEGIELSDPQHAIQKCDLIVFLVSHNEFKSLKIDTTKIILDFCGLTK